MKKNISIIVLLLIPNLFVYASTFYFDPQEKVVGTDKPFIVALNFDSKLPVNTISASIKIPIGLKSIRINNGNSIINSWIEEPSFNIKERIITFSGIIPGGFVGNGGRLVSLTLEAEGSGSVTIDVLRDESQVLLNSPDGVADSIDALPLHLTISSLKNNLDVSLPDSVPPEDFSPTLFTDKYLEGGKLVVLFNTQDKDSGVDHYEIQETRSSEPDQDYWKTAHSPQVLDDQALSSNIFIKAVDEKGNERISKIDAVNILSWYQSFKNWFIIISVILALLYARKSFKKKII